MSSMLVIWIFMVILGMTAMSALVWAIRSGQFQSIGEGAESIFDAEEPLGVTTDAFPSPKGSKKGHRS